MQQARFPIDQILNYKILFLDEDFNPKFIVLMDVEHIDREYNDDNWEFYMQTVVGRIQMFYKSIDIMTLALCLINRSNDEDLKKLDEFFTSDRRFKVVRIS